MIVTFKGKKYRKVPNILKPGNCTPCALWKHDCSIGSRYNCLDEKYEMGDPRRYYMWVRILELNKDIKIL